MCLELSAAIKKAHLKQRNWHTEENIVFCNEISSDSKQNPFYLPRGFSPCEGTRDAIDGPITNKNFSRKLQETTTITTQNKPVIISEDCCNN